MDGIWVSVTKTNLDMVAIRSIICESMDTPYTDFCFNSLKIKSRLPICST